MRISTRLGSRGASGHLPASGDFILLHHTQIRQIGNVPGVIEQPNPGVFPAFLRGDANKLQQVLLAEGRVGAERDQKSSWRASCRISTIKGNNSASGIERV